MFIDNNNNQRICPCKNCSVRFLYCHSYCIDYRIWNENQNRHKRTRAYIEQKEYVEYKAVKAKGYRQMRNI